MNWSGQVIWYPSSGAFLFRAANSVWPAGYKPADQQAGLQRAGFFEQAAFYGGAALRIFYGLPRFSEDLDFSLLKVQEGFSLQPFLDGMLAEFEALGMRVSVTEKTKTKQTKIDSAFLKANTTWKELVLKNIVPPEKTAKRPEIKINAKAVRSLSTQKVHPCRR